MTQQPTNKGVQMRVNATPADKAIITAAAKAARLSVSQYLLLAGLDAIAKSNERKIPTRGVQDGR